MSSAEPPPTPGPDPGAIPRRFDEHDTGLLQLVADRVAVAIERALYQAQRHARAEAEAAAEVIRRLQEVADAALPRLSLGTC